MKNVGDVYKDILRYDKKEDYLLSLVIFKPLARLFLVLLLRFFPDISPNVITLFSLLMGIVAGFCAYIGAFWWATLFVVISFTLDCMDGTIARMRSENKLVLVGAFWDFLADRMSLFSLWFGLSMYYFKNGFTWLMWANTVFIIVRLIYESLVLFLETKISTTMSSVFSPVKGSLIINGYKLKLGLGPDLIWGFYIVILLLPNFAILVCIASIFLHLIGFLYIGIRSCYYGTKFSS